MIKITFEVSEDFIRQNAHPTSDNMKEANDKHVIKLLFDLIGYGLLEKQLEKGKTEFVVTPDKLDDRSKDMYNNTIGGICLLAAFSETDKEVDVE